MNVKLSLLFVGGLTIVLVGCKALTVRDNRYDLLNAPSIVVDSQFKYIGNHLVDLPVVISVKYSGHAPMYTTTPVRSDIFIRTEGKKITEICAIETLETGRPLHGRSGSFLKEPDFPGVSFKGDEYYFNMFNSTSYSKSYIESYGKVLMEKGYDVSDLTMVVGKMTKRVRQSVMVSMVYAYNAKVTSIESDNQAGYLVKKIDKNFKVIQ